MKSGILTPPRARSEARAKGAAPDAVGRSAGGGERRRGAVRDSGRSCYPGRGARDTVNLAAVARVRPPGRPKRNVGKASPTARQPPRLASESPPAGCCGRREGTIAPPDRRPSESHQPKRIKFPCRRPHVRRPTAVRRVKRWATRWNRWRPLARFVNARHGRYNRGTRRPRPARLRLACSLPPPGPVSSVKTKVPRTWLSLQ